MNIFKRIIGMVVGLCLAGSIAEARWIDENRPMVPVIEVQIKYKLTPLKISIHKVTERLGYDSVLMTPIGQSAGRLVLSDGRNYEVAIPQLFDPPPLSRNDRAVLEQPSSGLIIIEFPKGEATCVRLVDKDGNILDIVYLSDAEKVPINKKYKTLKMSMIDWLIPSAEAADADKTEDIVFIGDNYLESDESLFNSNVDSVINHLKTYEPYKARLSQIAFHRVWNWAIDLNCVHSPSMNRLITCDYGITSTEVANAGVPKNHIIVIVKDSSYGGSGGSMAVTYNGGSMNQVAVHEFGHTQGGLLDEYNLYGASSYLPIPGKLYGNCCCTGESPAHCPDWDGLANLVYTQGCNYTNWYRSTSCSIMLQLGCQYFNIASQKIVNQRLDAIAGPFNPTNQPPIVSLSANPTSGLAPLAVVFTVNATDPEGGSLIYNWIFE